jgi:hypothetical protein
VENWRKREWRRIPNSVAVVGGEMAEVLTAHQPNELARIEDAIHDCFFDLARVEYDSTSRTLTIPFRKDDAQGGRRLALVSRALGRGEEYLMIIGHVESYDIEDRVKVRYYDFNRLTYDATTQLLSIVTGIPVRIDISVSALDIRVEGTGRPVEYR